jgi:beta-glucosidase
MKYKNFKWSVLILMVFAIWGCKKKVTTMEANQSATSADWNRRADSLLALMTLPEKLGQLQQLDGGISKDDLPQLIEEGKVGSVLNEIDVALVTKYQKVAIEKSRLGIPLLIGRDVIHGYRTVFPIPLAQSASWNTEIVEEGSRIAGKEASSVGINWTRVGEELQNLQGKIRF